MTDGFEEFSNHLAAAHSKRLQIRALIRAHNHERPRCSGCGNDMLLFKAADMVTREQYISPYCDYLHHEDFRPGDLICFECWFAMIADEDGRTGFVWGRA